MGIETAVIGSLIAGAGGGSAVAGSLIGAGASLIGNKMTSKAQKKAADKANQAQAARTNQALGYIEPAYGRAMDVRQGAYQNALSLQGQTFRPTIDAMQGGNVAAQRAILAGLPMSRAAILGGKIDYSQLQPYQQNIDTSIQGLFNPQAQQFRQPQRQPQQEQMTPEMMAYMQSQGGY